MFETMKMQGPEHSATSGPAAQDVIFPAILCFSSFSFLYKGAFSAPGQGTFRRGAGRGDIIGPRSRLRLIPAVSSLAESAWQSGSFWPLF